MFCLYLALHLALHLSVVLLQNKIAWLGALLDTQTKVTFPYWRLPVGNEFI